MSVFFIRTPSKKYFLKIKLFLGGFPEAFQDFLDFLKSNDLDSFGISIF